MRAAIIGIAILLGAGAAALVIVSRAPQDAAAVRAPGGDNKPVVFVMRTPAHASAGASSPAPASAPPVQTQASQAAIPPSSATQAPLAAASGRATAMPMTVATVAPQSVRLPAVPREAPDAMPRILAVTLSSPVARAGQVVSGTVETSSNVASVEARIQGYSMALSKTGVGRFGVSYTVPKLPLFLHKTYLIQLIARNTAGVSVSTAVPITVR
ncbi:MAG: hypothetical protein ABR508_11860 [Candidatus Baltobacteraceae bacterium]